MPNISRTKHYVAIMYDAEGSEATRYALTQRRKTSSGWRAYVLNGGWSLNFHEASKSYSTGRGHEGPRKEVGSYRLIEIPNDVVNEYRRKGFDTDYEAMFHHARKDV